MYRPFKFITRDERLKLLNVPANPPDGGTSGGGGTGGFSSAISATILGTAMPWSTVTNPAYDYSIHDGTAATVVTLASLPGYGSGAPIAISAYGTVDVSDGRPGFGPAGDPQHITGVTLGGTGTYFPTKFMPGTQLGRGGLCATFTDDAGVIIGTPFAIGNSLVITPPAGATKISLGTDDDRYADNTGSFVASFVVQSSGGGGAGATVNPLLLASSGGLLGLASGKHLLTPVFDSMLQRNTVIAPLDNFDTDDDCQYQFPSEEVDPGKVITVRRVRFKVRNLGIVKFRVTVKGMYDSTYTDVSFGNPDEFIPGTRNKVSSLADGRLYTLYADVLYSDQQVQLIIDRFKDNGPLSIISAALIGEAQELEQ